jgi:hypothetical protein
MDLTGKTRVLTPEGTTGSILKPDSKYLLTIDGQQKRIGLPAWRRRTQTLPNETGGLMMQS